jgi:hypothetical protein
MITFKIISNFDIKSSQKFQWTNFVARTRKKSCPFHEKKTDFGLVQY